jgi:peptidoglycan/xylan/chitin deacetylase (PgdA/CDA1 family)
MCLAAAAAGSPDAVVQKFEGKAPAKWAETLPGVTTRLAKRGKLIALTFDACGVGRDGYDAMLIDFLRREKIPATLFVTGRWIDRNPERFAELARDPLFEIENHGMTHKPASVNGNSKYGIKGTGSVRELVDEVEQNAEKIEATTGKKPRFFRSGTAYYDDVAVAVIHALGYRIAGFSVLGDAGATFKEAKVREVLSKAPPGSIVLCHMNHPESGTAGGVIGAVPALKKRGFKFVTLSQAAAP